MALLIVLVVLLLLLLMFLITQFLKGILCHEKTSDVLFVRFFFCFFFLM